MKFKRFLVVLSLACLLIAVAVGVHMWLNPMRGARMTHYLVLWPSLAIAIFAAGRILRARPSLYRYRRSFGLLLLFVAVLGPLCLIGPIEDIVNARALTWVDRELGTLTSHLDVRRGDVDTGFIDYLGPADHTYTLSLRTGPNGYLLETALPAMDIDGYTAYRVDDAPVWAYFHNDRPPAFSSRRRFEHWLEAHDSGGTNVRTAHCQPRQSCAGQQSLCVDNAHWRCLLDGNGW